MQTFLPYAYFPGSAKVLDRKRLDIQRDGRIIPPLKCGEDTNMLFVSREWIDRGYNDNCMSELKLDLEVVKMRGGELKLPPWYSNHLFHASHRANLLRKDFAHYSQFGWVEDPTMPYYWPEV